MYVLFIAGTKLGSVKMGLSPPKRNFLLGRTVLECYSAPTKYLYQLLMTDCDKHAEGLDCCSFHLPRERNNTAHHLARKASREGTPSQIGRLPFAVYELLYSDASV